VVVATNAGGSFSPFGDITTLLVWQKGVVPFGDFFALLIPALLFFGALDVILNATIGTLMFWELPHTVTFSQRCSRHFYSNDWRGRLARAFAVPLNAIDIGHIG